MPWSWPTCHCSKLAVAGDSVSVTVAIGIPRGARQRVQPLDLGGRVLGVVDPDLDLVRGDLVLRPPPCPAR